jgi:hypothetical protein
MTRSLVTQVLTVIGISTLAVACGSNRDALTAPTSLEAKTTQNDRGGNPPAGSPALEANGQVAGLSGACPSLRFTVGTRLVTTSAATIFADGQCVDVVAGRSVEVTGVAQGDALAATRVDVRGVAADDPANDPPHDAGDDHGTDGSTHDGAGNHDADQTEVRGIVAARAGACPALSFTIGSTPVQTNASTDFHDIACGAVANGVAVEARGAVRNGVFIATRVERR